MGRLPDGTRISVLPICALVTCLHQDLSDCQHIEVVVWETGRNKFCRSCEYCLDWPYGKWIIHKKFLSSTEHLYVQIFNDFICINLSSSRQGSPSKITCSSFGQWWPTSAASSHWGRNRWEQTKTGHWPRTNGTLKNVQSIWENPGGWPSLCKSSIHCNIVPKYFFHLWLSITRYISGGSRISERGSANVFKSSCGASEKNNKLHFVPRRNVIQNVLKSANIVFAECIVPVRSVSSGTTQQNVPTDWSAGGLHQGTPVSEVRCMYRWRPGPARKWSVSATTLVPVTNPPDRIVNWWVKLPKTMSKPSGNVQQWPLNRSRTFNRLIKTSYFLFS